MDLRRWQGVEQGLGLQPVFRGYVGGFEPSLFQPRRPPAGRARATAVMAKALNVALHARLQGLRRVNSRLTSGYLMAVYRRTGG